MHSYLRSIGFSNIKNRRLLTPITREIIAHPTTRNIITIDMDTRMVQLNKDFGKNFGISMVGELDIEERVSFEYYFPYVRSYTPVKRDRIYIEKHGDKESYAGVCDDYDLGMTLIFFLTNIADFENTKWLNYSNHLVNTACLSGLSTNGKIILNVEPDTETPKEKHASSAKRRKLIEAAKRGDHSAIEDLTIEDMDLYSDVIRRSHYEDVLSIVETSFMPCGIDSENYSLIGNILSCESLVNDFSGETIHIMCVETNGLTLHVAINDKDLLGAPAPGCRFKGDVWLQGQVMF